MADVFKSSADYFERTAAAFQKVANSKAYKANVSARAAIMREVAHYLECAARLRGRPVPKLSARR